MQAHPSFFAGFTSSAASRSWATSTARSTRYPITPPPRGSSSCPSWSLRDFGCGKAISFDGFFRNEPSRKEKRRDDERPTERQGSFPADRGAQGFHTIGATSKGLTRR